MQRRWANISLAIALVFFLLSLAFRHNPVAPYVLAGSLASLAGGVADWFAVTALFRHPLGLTWLPHTSIIAKNRDRIIDAIVVLVQNELLSLEFITATLNHFNVIDLLIQWLRLEGESEPEVIRRLLPEMLDLLPVDRLGDLLASYLDRQAGNWSVADMLAEWIKWLIQSEKDRDLFRFLGREAESVLNTVEFTEDIEQRLKGMIEHYSKTTTKKLLVGVLESMGTIDYKELSESIRIHLIEWIDSEHAFEQFELALVRVRLGLKDETKIRRTAEEIKMQLVRQIPWAGLLRRGVDQLKTAARDGSLAREIGHWGSEIADGLVTDPARREHLESLVKELAFGLLKRYHPLVGRLVRDNLQSMDEREWIDKLEWYVGRDLQWIRINGALVGGFVGLIMELVLRLTHVGL